MTRRIKLVVAYDGTDFCGWAAQPGQRTVQGTLKEAVRQVSGEDVEITGASRTDSGAHAEGQVCHFDTDAPIEMSNWVRALNRVTAPDVAVKQAVQVAESFHSRFWALDRIYEYRIRTGLKDPFLGRYAHQHGRPLDASAMRTAAKSLIGEHDFLAFTEELNESVENTTRTLFAVDVLERRNEVHLRVRGTAFLRGMMRRIAGGLLEVGRGKRPPDEIGRLLTEARKDLQWPVVLPAHGLTLLKVRYGRHPRDSREAGSSQTTETE